MNYLVMLHPRRTGPFRRVSDGMNFEFVAKTPVILTDKQLAGVASDLGSALVMVEEYEEKNSAGEVETLRRANWLQTKLMAIESAKQKIEAADIVGLNPGEQMSPFERDCWEHREEIAAEEKREANRPDVLGDLAEFLDVSIEGVQFLVDNGMPVGETKFESNAVDDWIKSEDGRPLWIEARKMLGRSDEDKDADPVVEPEDDEDDEENDDEESVDLSPVELSSQSKVAEHFRVSVDDVKSWVKDGLVKEGKVYKSSEVYQWLKANSKLGNDLSADFDEVNVLGLEVLELDSEYKVFTNFGTIIHNEELQTAEDVGKLLVEITSDLPEEEMVTE